MTHKPAFFGTFITLIFILIFGYSLAIASPGIFSDKIEIIYKSSNNIFPDTAQLNQNQIILKSYRDLSDVSFESSCDFHSKLIKKERYLYLYEFKFFNSSDCNGSILLESENEENSLFEIKFRPIYQGDIISTFVDYDDEKLSQIQSSLFSKLKNQGLYKNLTSSFDYKLYEKHRRYLELEYTSKIINNIVQKRSEKYLVPVAGYSIDSSHGHNRIPNAARPYRQAYTDGIHHGWDVGSKFGEQIRSLDDGVIVRVVSAFDWSDFDSIVRENITDADRVANLDILRGKQVWIKTAKGDVAFYSHLDDIYTHIKEGVVVQKGEPIGTIGTTGVPDKNYTNYHLHFAIHKNPYNALQAGKYTIDDYMNWKWLLQGESASDILRIQEDIFE